MTRLCIFKAQRIVDAVPDLVIEITTELPAECGQLEIEKQARTLADALRSSLPGSLLDLLTAELLEASASRLRVRVA